MALRNQFMVTEESTGNQHTVLETRESEPTTFANERKGVASASLYRLILTGEPLVVDGPRRLKSQDGRTFTIEPWMPPLRTTEP